jgi:hypothetical protein
MRGLRSEVRGLMPEVRFSLARPTTKECNSRLRKHFGSWKRRCYNRVTECVMHGSGSFPAEAIPSGRARLGTLTCPASK